MREQFGLRRETLQIVWRPVGHNQPVNIPMESCAEHVILVQSHGVLLLAYHVNKTEGAVQFSDSATGMIPTNAMESSTKVTVNDAYAGQFFRTSYGSIYKDFKREFYYFEIFEMIRKITLVGVLVLLGKAAGTQIFVGVIICFFYVLLGALTKPLIKPHDQFLQYVTSVQLFGTLITGLLLRNRAFEKAQGIGTEQDDMVIDVVLTLMTIAIVVCIVTVIAFVLGSKGKIVPVSRSGNVRGKK
eukprot:g14567.t1